MDGWKTSFLLGRPIFRGELLVSGRVSYWEDQLVWITHSETSTLTSSGESRLWLTVFNNPAGNEDGFLKGPIQVGRPSRRGTQFIEVEASFHLLFPWQRLGMQNHQPWEALRRPSLSEGLVAFVGWVSDLLKPPLLKRHSIGSTINLKP